jgi:hypothetical protein
MRRVVDATVSIVADSTAVDRRSSRAVTLTTRTAIRHRHGRRTGERRHGPRCHSLAHAPGHRRGSRLEVSALMTKAAALEAVDAFDWAGWQKQFKAMYAPLFTAIVRQHARAAVATTQKDDEPDPAETPTAKRFLEKYIATRITQIDETTREWVKQTITSALDQNEAPSVQQLATAIGTSRAFTADRALMIARTETAIGVNHGQLIGYAAAGFDKVEVSDGDGDDECAAADGQIWTIDEAMANPIAHPNCTRSFSPVAEG